MTRCLFSLVLFVAPSVYACPSGCIPYHEVCACDQKPEEAKAVKPDDAKPHEKGSPAYESGEVNIISAPSLTQSDEKLDQDKRNADAEGKKAAGL